MIRQRIESVFWTLKDRLGLERHRAGTLAGLRARIASKLLALAAGVWVNTLLGLPSRSFAQFAARAWNQSSRVHEPRDTAEFPSNGHQLDKKLSRSYCGRWSTRRLPRLDQFRETASGGGPTGR